MSALELRCCRTLAGPISHPKYWRKHEIQKRWNRKIFFCRSKLLSAQVSQATGELTRCWSPPSAYTLKASGGTRQQGAKSQLEHHQSVFTSGHPHLDIPPQCISGHNDAHVFNVHFGRTKVIAAFALTWINIPSGHLCPWADTLAKGQRNRRVGATTLQHNSDEQPTTRLAARCPSWPDTLENLAAATTRQGKKLVLQSAFSAAGLMVAYKRTSHLSRPTVWNHDATLWAVQRFLWQNYDHTKKWRYQQICGREGLQRLRSSCAKLADKTTISQRNEDLNNNVCARRLTTASRLEQRNVFLKCKEHTTASLSQLLRVHMDTHIYVVVLRTWSQKRKRWVESLNVTHRVRHHQVTNERGWFIKKAKMKVIFVPRSRPDGQCISGCLTRRRAILTRTSKTRPWQCSPPMLRASDPQMDWTSSQLWRPSCVAWRKATHTVGLRRFAANEPPCTHTPCKTAPLAELPSAASPASRRAAVNSPKVCLRKRKLQCTSRVTSPYLN